MEFGFADAEQADSNASGTVGNVGKPLVVVLVKLCIYLQGAVPVGKAAVGKDIVFVFDIVAEDVIQVLIAALWDVRLSVSRLLGSRCLAPWHRAPYP